MVRRFLPLAILALSRCKQPVVTEDQQIQQLRRDRELLQMKRCVDCGGVPIMTESDRLADCKFPPERKP